MKKLIILLSLLLLVGCEKKDPKTSLDVWILNHPIGGEDVSRLTCRMYGELNFREGKGLFQSKGKAKPITVNIEWWWEDFYGINSEMVSSEFFTFNSEGTAEFSTSYAAQPGYILLNYYWVRVSWTDDGGENQVESVKAYCY